MINRNTRNSAIAGPKPGWERRRGHTDSNTTLHTYSDTERNTPNTQEGVSREGSVSPRGMREVTHGADAYCSPPTVVAEWTLPAAGLSPSGWPSREPYRQAFPSGGPAGRTRWNGFSEPSSAWRRGVEQKHQGTLNRFLDAVWVKTVWMRGAS